LQIRPYRGQYPGVVDYLLDKGVLKHPPRQVHREDLIYDEGIDITYEFKKLTPEKFKEFADTILLAAETEASRYGEEYWKFAYLDVELGGSPKGRTKSGEDPLIRTFTAGKHKEPDIMVYGPGYEVGEPTFLIDKVQQILEIPERYRDSQGKQRPYKVLRLVIGIRMGLKALVTKIEFGKKQLEEGAKSKELTEGDSQ